MKRQEERKIEQAEGLSRQQPVLARRRREKDLEWEEELEGWVEERELLQERYRGGNVRA